MRRVVHRRCEFPASRVFLLTRRPLGTDPAGSAVLMNLAKTASAVNVVAVFPLRIDKIAELARQRLFPAEHRLRTEAGGFAKHIMLSGLQGRPDDFITPFQRLLPVRQTDQGNRAVNILSRLHHLNALRSMKPWLRDNDDRVKIASADLIQRGIHILRVEFVRKERIVRKFPDPLRFAVAERDTVHERMRLEQSGKCSAECSESHHSDTDTHTFSPPVC